jgi:hypothetical protein
MTGKRRVIIQILVAIKLALFFSKIRCSYFTLPGLNGMNAFVNFRLAVFLRFTMGWTSDEEPPMGHDHPALGPFVR